ncbi:MAG TPA: hypothetical protein VKB12_08435 [Pyrinomonadaceae bacterium]|nr:hypothetical protein [Pyrinomonadaceae bacterium]
MSDCKVFRTEIDSAADGGALGPRAASHVEVCAACGDELRGREALRALVGGLGRVEAPPDFEYRLRARMARSKPGGGHGVFGRLFPVSGLAWAAFAVCVLSLTAAVYFRQSRPAGQNAPGVAESAHAPQTPAGSTASESNNAAAQLTQRQTVQPGDRQTAAAVAPVAGGKRRASNVKRVASQTREREPLTREPRAESTGGGSLVADLRPARIQLPLLNSGSNAASSVAAQGIQLGTTAGTLRVAMRDERGALVPMRSVSFGSQEPLSRQTAGVRVSTQDEEGVW